MDNLETVILKEWQIFLEKAPKDTTWLAHFEDFIQTEPYKSAFTKWSAPIVMEQTKKKKEQNHGMG